MEYQENFINLKVYKEFLIILENYQVIFKEKVKQKIMRFDYGQFNRIMCRKNFRKGIIKKVIWDQEEVRLLVIFFFLYYDV